MKESFVIVHKDENGNLQKSANLSHEEANKYCLYLEVIHGLGTHVVISLENFEKGELPKNFS